MFRIPVDFRGARRLFFKAPRRPGVCYKYDFINRLDSFQVEVSGISDARECKVKGKQKVRVFKLWEVFSVKYSINIELRMLPKNASMSIYIVLQLKKKISPLKYFPFYIY